MTYAISPWAEKELNEAAVNYEKQVSALGFEFLDEIDKAIQRIIDFSEAWGLVSRNVRLCQLERFPYGIIYFLRDEIIHIVAVVHLHRRPGYWKNRLKKMAPDQG